MKQLVCFGEALVDIVQSDKAPETFVGGAPLNVAAAFSKCGGKARLLTKMAADDWAALIVESGLSEGVDFSLTTIDRKTRTVCSHVTVDAHGDRHFTFSKRRGSFLYFGKRELPKTICQSGDIFYFGTVSMLSKKSHATAFHAVKQAKKEGALIAFDPNIRLALFRKKKVLRYIHQSLPFVDILKVSEEEAEMIVHQKNPEQAAKALLSSYPSLQMVLVTQAEKGALVASNKTLVSLPARPIKVVDTIGAGDGFFGSFLYACDFSKPSVLETALDFAIAYAARVCTQKGAIPMPDLSH